MYSAQHGRLLDLRVKAHTGLSWGGEPSSITCLSDVGVCASDAKATSCLKASDGGQRCARGTTTWRG